MSSPLDRLGALRQPEYTGENRCGPCTVLNAIIAVVIGADVVYVASATGVGPFRSVLVGLLTAGALGGVIYLRGYLVPYTPTLTERYVPERVLRYFEKGGETQTTPSEETDLEERLVSLGAVEECPDRADLCLAPPFRRRWHREIESTREAEFEEWADTVADLFDHDGDTAVERRGDGAVVRVDGLLAGRWASEAALVADIAAERVLRASTDEWANVAVRTRGRLRNSLRMFLERCPACDGPVSMGADTIDTCCRSADAVAVDCEACGARVFESQIPSEMESDLDDAAGAA